ncbi:hypothetical protein I204_01076 [Kwoniella mangroviensis CBS 8886]|nr:hypothetical protein I204_01076 [Kwoniella mangroviensis CBS 8886]
METRSRKKRRLNSTSQFDWIERLTIHLPPGISSPRINYSPESFAKVSLRRHIPENLSSSHNTRVVHRTSPQIQFGVLCFRINDWIYTGRLWEIYRGTLSIAGYRSHEIPIVMKVLRPDTFDRGLSDEDQSSDGLAAAYTFTRDYDPASAVKAAYNEDSIYRQLTPMQGTVIPEYYGLFISYQNANGIIDDGATLPKMMAILLEDLGNQVDPHDMFDDEYSMEEWRVASTTLHEPTVA